MSTWLLRLMRIKSTGVVLLLLTGLPALGQQYIATSRNATAPIPGAVMPARANDFLDSIGVNLHCESTRGPYYMRYAKVKMLLKDLGIRLVRTDSPSEFCVKMTRDLYATLGIRTNYLVLPYQGLSVDKSFASTADPQYLGPFLKSAVGPEAIASVEITNEPDVFFHYYKWHISDPDNVVNSATAPDGWGLYGPAITTAAYKIMKADSVLKSIPVYGPALGYYANGFAAGSMADSTDFGSMHPYPYGGNGNALATSYDGIKRYFLESDQPSVNIDEFPFAFQAYQPAFTSQAPGAKPKPMVATETGYFTGTAQKSVSPYTQAKYMPRLIAEYFRHGIEKTYLYDFVDDGTNPANKEDNFGLITNDLQPKPAFVALRSLFALLRDRKSGWRPTPLQYVLVVKPNGPYTRTQYVHDLLLQKSNGDYDLLLWHEVSGASLADSNGTAYPGTAADLQPLPLATSITLPTNIGSAILYTYDTSWQLHGAPVEIRAGKLTVPATDSISIVQMKSTPAP